jgi:hypothetical protein
MTTGTIRLTYGNFTCSFDRIAEEDVMTRAIIKQIAEIVIKNPSFGGNTTFSGTSPTPSSSSHASVAGKVENTAQSNQGPMRLENPIAGPVSISVSDTSAEQEPKLPSFDTAFGLKPIEFLRSRNVGTNHTHIKHVADNAVLLEKYETLRAAVLRMLDETDNASPTAAPTVLKDHERRSSLKPKVSSPVLETETTSENKRARFANQGGSTLRVFPMARGPY